MRGQFEYPHIAEDDPRSYIGSSHILADWTPSGVQSGFQFMQISGSVKTAAACGLLHLMGGLSEQFYSAGWLNNLEYALWDRRERGPSAQGQFCEMSDRQCILLRSLSEECQGWWVQSREHQDALQLLSLSAWRSHIEDNWIHRGGFEGAR